LAAVLGEVVACAAAPEGTAFSAKLNRAAYTAGGLVAAGHLSPAAEHARPGQERRYGSIIRGGPDAGSLRPLSPGSRA
jgi:hypothetical protein